MTPQGQLFQSIVPLLLIFGVFYVLMILPMRKRQRSLQQLVDSLKKGDRVITTGGVYGEVAAVDTATVILKVADNVKLKVAYEQVPALVTAAVVPGRLATEQVAYRADVGSRAGCMGRVVLEGGLQLGSAVLLVVAGVVVIHAGGDATNLLAVDRSSKRGSFVLREPLDASV